jgi:hypothetical protein
MTNSQIEILKKRLTGRTVRVDAQRPELAVWAEKTGRVIDVNWNGLALVQFEGADQGWYDISPEYLTVVESAG